jgi:hypothetical protein
MPVLFKYSSTVSTPENATDACCAFAKSYVLQIMAYLLDTNSVRQHLTNSMFREQA